MLGFNKCVGSSTLAYAKSVFAILEPFNKTLLLCRSTALTYIKREKQEKLDDINLVARENCK